MAREGRRGWRFGTMTRNVVGAIPAGPAQQADAAVSAVSEPGGPGDQTG